MQHRINEICANPANAALALEVETITAERAERALAKTHTTTTELLLLLVQFHLDADDADGAELLADFAATFAEHEAGVV